MHPEGRVKGNTLKCVFSGFMLLYDTWFHILGKPFITVNKGVYLA